MSSYKYLLIYDYAFADCLSLNTVYYKDISYQNFDEFEEVTLNMINREAFENTPFANTYEP